MRKTSSDFSADQKAILDEMIELEKSKPATSLDTPITIQEVSTINSKRVNQKGLIIFGIELLIY